MRAVALMRREPEVEGRSEYGAKRAEPQEPRAPSVDVSRHQGKYQKTKVIGVTSCRRDTQR